MLFHILDIINKFILSIANNTTLTTKS